MRILLVPNTHNPSAVTAALELSAWLSAMGLEPVLSGSDARECGMDSFGVAATEIGTPGLVVALGGDGTILKAFHILGEVDAPILGIKFGRLGFLSGARPETMRPAIESAIAGEAPVERRATLKADVIMDGKVTGTYRAMNEVVVARGVSAKVIELAVSIDDKQVAQVRADGLVVATATGSTAYAMSAGGPIVAPGHGGMVVVPVAPHTLQARAVVTGPSEVVEVSLPDTMRAEACVIVDGEVTPSRKLIERVVVSRAEHDVSLVKCDGRSFYATVADEFFGG